MQVKAPTIADYWRGIVLYGRNVQSYKFALSAALLELAPDGGDLLKLADLAPTYAKHLCRHLQLADKQGTARSSRFLNTCRAYNAGQATETKLLDDTIRLGFNNVIGAFHVVSGEPIDEPFFVDERKTAGGIRITDRVSQLRETNQYLSLSAETEARWRLVETAWELNVTRSVIEVQHDRDDEELFAIGKNNRRKAITNSRDALNGYQRGHCFYCFDSISLDPESLLLPDVDHFIPHAAGKLMPRLNLDGIWNLVLACKDCNRGVAGKFDKLPEKHLLERLNTRNEYLIGSNHPLKETLIAQTGSTPKDRASFLSLAYQDSWALILNRWSPAERGHAIF